MSVARKAAASRIDVALIPRRRFACVTSRTTPSNFHEHQLLACCSHTRVFARVAPMAHLLAEIENYNESGRTTPLNGCKASKEPTPPHIHEVVLGNWWVRPWYPSFYPKELVGSECERLYVCPSCFKYTREVEDGAYLRHMVSPCHAIRKRDSSRLTAV